MAALAFIMPTQAQSVEEIIENYFENTGGLEAWKSLEGIKINAKFNQQGMEFPVAIYQLKDGRQMSVISFQGQEFKQGVYDGEVLWNTNFQTMKAEKSDAEATANMQLDANDFPDSFVDYKEKGYTVELLGTEEFDGTETFKVKLVKEPVTIDGTQEDNVSYYYFDTENFVPLGMQAEIRTGQAKGMTSEVVFSDYQEVEGLYFAFSLSQGIKDGPSNPITVESIELNPEVDDAAFAFPEEVVIDENKN